MLNNFLFALLHFIYNTKVTFIIMSQKNKEKILQDNIINNKKQR